MANLEQDAINKLASAYSNVSGIRNAYSFASNPDSLAKAMLPAVLLFPEGFTHTQRAHYNRWQTTLTVKAILFVLPREMLGARLKFLDNEAMPFGQSVRNKFEDASVINDLLTAGNGCTEAWLIDGAYGAGGRYLTHNGTEYIGWVFTHRFSNQV